MIGMISLWKVVDLDSLIQQVNYNHSLIYQVLNFVFQCPAIFDFMPEHVHMVIAMNVWIKPFWDACPRLGLDSSNEFIFYEPSTHGEKINQ